MKKLSQAVKHSRFSPLEVCILIPITAFLYTFMEWLFIISKPSFIDTSTFLEKGVILFNASAILALVGMAALIPFIILYYCLHIKAVRVVLRFLMCLVPALIMAATLLLLVDNITYSAFTWGIVSTKGLTRVLYLAGFSLLTLALTIPAFRISHAIERSRRKATRKQKTWLPAILGSVLVLLVLLPVVFNPNLTAFNAKAKVGQSTQKYPNILLITGDGINASKLSLYGAKKDTTPFLSELAKTSLVGENNFSNAQGTIGSTTSFLTGKYAEDTRVLAATDILQGQDAVQSLPSILKAYGYYTVQLSFSYYGDAYRINFEDAFDEANGESPVTNPIQTKLAEYLPTNYYYFMREMYSRITDRLGHIFFIKDMTNPFIQVTEAPEKFNDQQKLDFLFKLLSTSQKPVFVHIHWMGTHGPKYYPDRQVFSAGKDPKTQANFDESFNLDSILEFDGAIKSVYQELEKLKIVDQTILAVSSDHTQHWTVSSIPLLIHFPDSQYAGQIFENTQNLDFAPTFLDYVGIPQPDWMPGRSLLKKLDPNQPIFIAAIPDSKKDPVTGAIIYPPVVPPYFQFGKMSVVVCDHFYQALLLQPRLIDGEVPDHKGSCPMPPISRKDALQLIIDHMQQYGFDTSQLETLKP